MFSILFYNDFNILKINALIGAVRFNIYFFNSWRRLFLFNLIVKTIQKYFARPYNP